MREVKGEDGQEEELSKAGNSTLVSSIVSFFAKNGQTSTTAAVLSNRLRRSHTRRPNHPASSQSPPAHILSPVVPHHLSSCSTLSKPDVSKLAPIAHQPQRNKENGMATAVARRTGRTVLRRRNKNAGGSTIGGIRSASRRGRRGTTDGADLFVPSGKGYSW